MNQEATYASTRGASLSFLTVRSEKERENMPLKEASQESQVQPSHRLQGWVLFSVLAAQMLSLWLEALDSTIIGTSLPHITASLYGFADTSWVVTAYLLASVTMIPIAGKLSDQFGRKWFLV